MATFTIDLFSGDVYLFDKDFSSSGGTSGGTTTTYPQVDNFSDLPPASTSNGEIYVVLNSSGLYIINRKDAGLYYSNGSSWRRLGDIPPYFLNNNFQIIDSSDPTKGVSFETSGITTNTFRRIKFQNSNGTIAYLTDVNLKVDKTLFNTYTGTTAPNRFLGINNFNFYSGLTETRLDNIELSIAAINQYNAIQLTDIVGGINVNVVAPTPIEWTTVEFTGSSLNYTGASRIYIQDAGEYEIAYNLVVRNDDNNSKTIGTLIRKNGIDHITPLSVSASISGGVMITSSNNIASYKRTLAAGDYVQLLGFIVGNSGNVYTVPTASWISIIRK